jgi:hypothetical protein
MSVRGVCAVRLQLARELRHAEWLSKHIPHSAQLCAAQLRVSELEAELAVILSEYKQEERAEARSSRITTSNRD